MMASSAEAIPVQPRAPVIATTVVLSLHQHGIPHQMMHILHGGLTVLIHSHRRRIVQAAVERSVPLTGRTHYKFSTTRLGERVSGEASRWEEALPVEEGVALLMDREKNEDKCWTN